MRLQRKHDVQNRGKREQRTTRNKNTVIHGVGIAAIRNRRTTWRGTCRSPTAQQPQRKPDTVSGRARKTRKWRWMQPTRLPGDRRSGGRRSRIPVRTGCGRQENESPHPQCHPAFFTPHAHPGKSKTSPDQLTKRRFQYPEPVQAIEIIGKQKNLFSLLSITCTFPIFSIFAIFCPFSVIQYTFSTL